MERNEINYRLRPPQYDFSHLKPYQVKYAGMKAILGSLRALIRPWGAHMSGSQSLGLDKTKLWGVAGLGLDKATAEWF